MASNHVVYSLMDSHQTDPGYRPSIPISQQLLNWMNNFVDSVKTSETLSPTNQTSRTHHSTNQTSTTLHSTNQTSTTLHSTNQTSTTLHSTNQTSTTLHSTNQTSTTLHTTNQTSTTLHSTNQTSTTLHSTNQTSGTLHSTKTVPGSLRFPNKTSATLHATRKIKKRPNSRSRMLQISKNLNLRTCPNKMLLISKNLNIHTRPKNELTKILTGWNPNGFGDSRTEPCKSSLLGDYDFSESYVESEDEYDSSYERLDEGVERTKVPYKLMSLATKNNYTNRKKLPAKVYDEMKLVEYKKYLIKLFDEAYKWCSVQEGNKPSLRIDQQAWKIVQKSGFMFTTSKTFGPIPGVEIGDSFNLRRKLVIMGIHSQIVRGIDCKTTTQGRIFATSIVATKGYYDKMEKPDELIYTGEGGTFEANGKYAKDQELNRGNLALKNSMDKGNFVRVVRGMKISGETLTTFVYDGLYKVVECYKERGGYGKILFKFKLFRCPGQKPIQWNRYF